MPQFVLNSGGRVQIQDAPFMGATLIFANLDAFTQGYIEALFFTNEGKEDGQLGDDASFNDLAPETLARIMADCATFQTANAELLALAYDRDDYGDTQAGRDFWFTRCGHGVGFWDRSQLDAEGLGDKLSEAARRTGNVDPYLGDDKKIYMA